MGVAKSAVTDKQEDRKMLFARKDETVSTLQPKYNGGTGAMSIDDYARRLSRVTLPSRSS